MHSNLRGDVPAKLRIRYDDLKHLNPAIVCSSLSGFGMTGPRSAEPATTTCSRVWPGGWTSPPRLRARARPDARGVAGRRGRAPLRRRPGRARPTGAR
ncbi:CoA transferase [Sphaerisporangium album]|uniref:CoA transferase n=1 Tax=Sphaerisporangium album TaxID=509200 RepID=UPI00319EB16E